MPSNTTFQKRQKELARKEKQRAKAERKAQRKLEKQSPGYQEGGSEADGEVVETDPDETVGSDPASSSTDVTSG